MTKKAHILGVCGTFMGSLAILLKQSGWNITGSDKAAYPPMSDLLAENEIDVLKDDPCVANSDNGLMVIGNAMSRGNASVEAILDAGIDYISGPALLSQEVLAGKHVIAIAGTHGKTTTTSMLAWILEYAGHNPGFLIGGRPQNFSVSARVTDSPVFIIEADEYDTAFFDKRSKFLHYKANDLLINNIEFDHADIFANLQEIQTQFHHVVRTIPSTGSVAWFSKEKNVADVIAKGCWSKQIHLDKQWQVEAVGGNSQDLIFSHNSSQSGRLNWQMHGMHNANNALASVALAYNYGVSIDLALQALREFKGVARRQQKLHSGRMDIYDDFAHHPTAIAKTLAGLREQIANRRLVVLLHLASNTMCSGEHANSIPQALKDANLVVVYQTKGQSIDKDLQSKCPAYKATCHDEQTLIEYMSNSLEPTDCLVIMSNGDLGGIRDKLIERAMFFDNQPT